MKKLILLMMIAVPVFLTGCKKDNLETDAPGEPSMPSIPVPDGYLYTHALIVSVDLPKTVRLGNTIKGVVNYFGINACQTFSHFENDEKDFVITINGFTLCPSDVLCAQVLIHGKSVCSMKLRKRGVYTFKFWNSEGYVVKKVTVN